MSKTPERREVSLRMYCFPLSPDIIISSLRSLCGAVVQRQDLSARQLFIRQKSADEARALPRGWRYKIRHGPQQQREGDPVSASPIRLKHKIKTARTIGDYLQGNIVFQFTFRRCLKSRDGREEGQNKSRPPWSHLQTGWRIGGPAAKRIILFAHPTRYPPRTICSIRTRCTVHARLMCGAAQVMLTAARRMPRLRLVVGRDALADADAASSGKQR